ncbi:hypothetical protein HHL11_15025 [Ramlibacter sp. G-1-2-2]|uniref:CHRD domain-containing protein n=1 Tax=Ramlibacter agri TaxID=2728837 RepID=A0A848H6C9_9BURK|nr:hypothetical protein [Ramlibacter agri]NML45069.1 hypothetical protein [Ramlibacter agri]
MKAITSALVLAACASTAAWADVPPMQVPLAPAPGNGGSLGRATLFAAPEGTRIELFFTSAGLQPTAPLHVYTYLYEGRCGALPAAPAYALTQQVLVRTPQGNLAASRRGAFTLSQLAPLPLDELAGGRFALALRASPADGGGLLYCGEIA